MAKKRYQFSTEQKRKAVDEYVSGKRRAEDIARDLGVPQGYLYKWRVQLDEAAKGLAIEELAEVIGISMSTYYSDPKISRAEREEFEADIRGKIEQVRVEHPMTGYRPLLYHLKRQSVEIGERKLRSIIKKFELQVRPKKRYVVTTMSDHDLLRYPNLIEEITIDGPNQVWASDITYIRIENSFAYLAVIIDLFSRKIIGWQISKKIDAKLTVDALKMAFARRKPKCGVIHHSDQGVQYLSDDYAGMLLDHGFYISCSAKGNPYDNA